MEILVSLIVGAGFGAFVYYAVDLPCSTLRNIAICTLGGLVVGVLAWALLPALPLVVTAVAALAGAGLAYYLHARSTFIQNEFRYDM